VEHKPDRTLTRPGVGLETLEPRLRSLLPAELYAPVWLQPDAEGLERVFVHLRTLLRILYDQMPSHVADDPPPTASTRHEWQTGTLMFTDLAGFTPFIEANATSGRAGIELVHAVLNRYLSAMIDVFGHAGGNLLEFTGDALLVRFASDDRGNDTRRAINAGLRMQRAMDEFRAVETPSGTATFGMRVGIHVGEFLAADVGTPRRRDHVLFGEAVRRTKAAEGAGHVGRVCLTAEAVQRAGERFGVEPLDDGHYLVVDDLTDSELGFYDLNPQVRRPRNPMLLDRGVPALIEEIGNSLDLVEPLATYMPRPLLEAMVETAQDRRIPMEMSEPVVMFVKVEGFDSGLEGAAEEAVHARMQAFSTLFARVDAAAAARGGMLRRVTYQATGSDMLVCFGVLNSHTDDPRRAASMALQVSGIVDDVIAEFGGQLDTDISFRIGMADGPVFAGEMGVQLGRREFNLVGDPVNVAARLAAKAAPGSVFVATGLADRLADTFALASLGQMSLKGKADAAEVFELRAAV
jgi:hypothetical protein